MNNMEITRELVKGVRDFLELIIHEPEHDEDAKKIMDAYLEGREHRPGRVERKQLLKEMIKLESFRARHCVFYFLGPLWSWCSEDPKMPEEFRRKISTLRGNAMSTFSNLYLGACALSESISHEPKNFRRWMDSKLDYGGLPMFVYGMVSCYLLHFILRD